MSRRLALLALLLFLGQTSGSQPKHRDSGENPDEDDHRQACEKISGWTINPHDAKPHIDNILQRLQNEDLLPSENPIDKARQICEDPTQENSRVCVFLHKHDLINKITIDFDNIGPGLQRAVYMKYWCKHPLCVQYTTTCTNLAHHHEDLGGYMDCKDENILPSTDKAKTAQVIS